MGAVWKLPVIYVCENNMYGMFTPASTVLSVLDISKKAEAYGIPGITVDGMDVIAVYEAVNEAVERARKGLGPSLIECKTYRYYGHFGPDEIEPVAKPYRTMEEIEAWRQRDPIKTFRTKLIDSGVFTEAEAQKIDEKVKAEIEDAVKFAEEGPSPAPEDALEDLFVS